MKIILSRKGFDSGSGGTASPILPWGAPCSLPIPDARSRTRYQDVQVCNHPNGEKLTLGGLVSDLTNGKMKSGYPCHLDPDLEVGAIKRKDGWRAAFGQTSHAQSHLVSQQVGLGDLFLFFGWFRNAEFSHDERTGDGKWTWMRGAPQIHAMFGWMQIGEILPIHGNEEALRGSHPWLEGHPHLNRRTDVSNHIYVATEKLSIPGLSHLPGAGTFKSITQARTLTAAGQSKRSYWALPEFLHPKHGTRLSYHEDLARWSLNGSKAHLQSVGRGQEFVITAEKKTLSSWLKRDIFQDIR